jgi:DNA-directed RNA polymerase subunit RPC12/RpoP
MTIAIVVISCIIIFTTTVVVAYLATDGGDSDEYLGVGTVFGLVLGAIFATIVGLAIYYVYWVYLLLAFAVPVFTILGLAGLRDYWFSSERQNSRHIARHRRNIRNGRLKESLHVLMDSSPGEGMMPRCLNCGSQLSSTTGVSCPRCGHRLPRNRAIRRSELSGLHDRRRSEERYALLVLLQLPDCEATRSLELAIEKLSELRYACRIAERQDGAKSWSTEFKNESDRLADVLISMTERMHHLGQYNVELSQPRVALRLEQAQKNLDDIADACSESVTVLAEQSLVGSGPTRANSAIARLRAIADAASESSSWIGEGSSPALVDQSLPRRGGRYRAR